MPISFPLPPLPAYRACTLVFPLSSTSNTTTTTTKKKTWCQRPITQRWRRITNRSWFPTCMLFRRSTQCPCNDTRCILCNRLLRRSRKHFDDSAVDRQRASTLTETRLDDFSQHTLTDSRSCIQYLGRCPPFFHNDTEPFWVLDFYDNHRRRRWTSLRIRRFSPFQHQCIAATAPFFGQSSHLIPGRLLPFIGYLGSITQGRKRGRRAIEGGWRRQQQKTGTMNTNQHVYPA